MNESGIMDDASAESKMATVTERELRDHPDLHGSLLSLHFQSIQNSRGELLLRIQAGGDGYAESHHLFLADALQLLKVAAHIRRTLAPTVDEEILAALRQIEQKL